MRNGLTNLKPYKSAPFRFNKFLSRVKGELGELILGEKYFRFKRNEVKLKVKYLGTVTRRA